MSDTQSVFDPALLLDSTIAQPNTRRPPLPPSDYIASIADLKAEPWASKDGTKSGSRFNVQLKVQITDATLQAVQGGSEVTIFDTIMLDMTPDGKGMDNSPGKNNPLRRYREALGLNEVGQPFTPRQMIGRQLRVKIKHEAYQGEMYDRVDSVAKV